MAWCSCSLFTNHFTCPTKGSSCLASRPNRGQFGLADDRSQEFPSISGTLVAALPSASAATPQRFRFRTTLPLEPSSFQCNIRLFGEALPCVAATFTRARGYRQSFQLSPSWLCFGFEPLPLFSGSDYFVKTKAAHCHIQRLRVRLSMSACRPQSSAVVTSRQIHHLPHRGMCQSIRFPPSGQTAWYGLAFPSINRLSGIIRCYTLSRDV